MADEIAATLLVDCRNTLAEGIQWHPVIERLFWTDINGSTLWCCDVDGDSLEQVEMPERVGSFAFLDDGKRLLLALESGLAVFDPQTGDLLRLGDIEPEHPTTRMNDGRCDREGRFVFGGIDEDGLKPISAVYRYGGGDRLHKLIDGVGCTNSICFSPDGRWMYVADTPTGIIRRYDYPEDDGPLGDAVEFVDLTSDKGNPDGSCIDADGRIWNARFEGGRIQSYDEDAVPGPAITLPVSQVTCCCFGGLDLDRLFITTARENFTPERDTQEPTAGGIFIAEVGEAFGATGLEEDWFTGELG